MRPILSPHGNYVLVATDQFSQQLLLQELQYLAGRAYPIFMSAGGGASLATWLRGFP